MSNWGGKRDGAGSGGKRDGAGRPPRSIKINSGDAWIVQRHTANGEDSAPEIWRVQDLSRTEITFLRPNGSLVTLSRNAANMGSGDIFDDEDE